MNKALRRERREKFCREVLPKVRQVANQGSLDIEEFANGHHRVMNDLGQSIDFWESGKYQSVAGRYLDDDYQGSGLIANLKELIKQSQQNL